MPLDALAKPAAEEAGVPPGFHTFGHTCASRLFECGDDAKQVQRWLGHHASSFTLHTYIHLLRDDLDAPLDVVAPRARSLKSLYDAIVT